MGNPQPHPIAVKIAVESEAQTQLFIGGDRRIFANPETTQADNRVGFG